MRIRKVFLAVLALIVIASCAGAEEDNFLYGVQIFSRPFDWTSPYDAQAQKAGQARFLELLKYALSLDVDILRGGTTYDNMLDHAGENNNAGVFRGMNFLLPVIRDNGLILDWVITGTSQTSLNRLNELMTLAGEHVRSSGANVIYEIWNEPDLKAGTFWSGTRDYYYSTFLPDASQAIKTADPEAKIMNGGLVLNPNDGDKSYVQPAIEALKAGDIFMLAIHAHDNLADFCRLWEEENFAGNGADVSKILLNECGANYSNSAFHIAGKLLKAKSFGAGGFIVFHLGGLTSSESFDGVGGYSLIDLQADGSLVPNAGYYALKTAIKYTKGLKYSEEVTAPDGYTLLFEDSTGRKTLAGIGRRPSQSEIDAAFGSEGYDAEYDLTGNRITNGSAIDSSNIVYLVFEPKISEPEISISITTPSQLPAALAFSGTTYSQTFTADTDEPITWTHISGDLPAGLNLDSLTGTLSGMPTIAGTYTFTVRAATQNFSTSKIFTLTVKLAITTDSVLPDAVSGDYYTQTLRAAGASSITWTHISGDIPAGLTLNANGTISGTPTTAGSYDFTVQADAGSDITAAKQFRITVAGKEPETQKPVSGDTTTITITKTSLMSGTVGTFYSDTITASEAGVTWSISSSDRAGNLPSGLTLNSSTGEISGTPTEAGSFTFIVFAEKGSKWTVRRYTLKISSFAITTASLPAGAVGSPYSYTFQANAPVSKWSIDCPDWLTPDSSTGKISGTPAKADIYTLTVRAENPYADDIKYFSINVSGSSGGAVGGSGGGCSAGLGIFGISALLILKRR